MESWAAENRHETCCTRLDDFDWVIPPCDLVERLARPEGTRNYRTLRIEVAAVEPSCFPVAVQTRPQVGCDPDLPLPVY